MERFSAYLRHAMAAGIAASAVFASLGADDAQARKIVIKQTNIYVATLPTGCVKTMYGNVVVWRCGSIYYQPYKGRYVRVYIN